MRYAWTPKFQLSGSTVHSYTVDQITFLLFIQDERFLIVLSCCSYLRDGVLPKIVSNYQSNGHAGLENLLPVSICFKILMKCIPNT